MVEASDMQARIIEAATGLFVARGFRGIAMREIAAAAGISKAGLYYYFADKEELFLAILTANLETVAQTVRAACGESTDIRQRVTRMLQAILTLPPNQRALIRLANQEIVHVSPAARSSFEGIYHQKFLGQVADVLQTGIANGDLRAINVQLVTWLLLGMAYPFFASNQPCDGVNEIVELIVAIFFDGLSQHERTAPRINGGA